LGKSVAAAVAPEIKTLLSDERCAWKKRLGKQFQEGGCHEAAEQMRKSFQKVVLEAFSKVRITTEAESAWTR